MAENPENISSIEKSHQSGDLFHIGSTIVTYKFNDKNGNTGICSFDVIGKYCMNLEWPLASVVEVLNKVNQGKGVTRVSRLIPLHSIIVWFFKVFLGTGHLNRLIFTMSGGFGTTIQMSQASPKTLNSCKFKDGRGSSRKLKITYYRWSPCSDQFYISAVHYSKQKNIHYTATR